MQLPRLFFVSMLVMIATQSHGQSNNEFSGPYPNEPKSGTIRAPAHKKRLFSPRRAEGYKLKKQKVTHTAQYEFYKRVEKAAKEHQRALRILAKPQYSNFLYYGHKRKPKKHEAYKMRYCEECGIRH